MAWIAKEVSAKTLPNRDSAAELTLPVYMLSAMCFTICLSISKCFNKTILAEQVFFLGIVLLFICHILLAVPQSSKVRFLTLVTEED